MEGANTNSQQFRNRRTRKNALRPSFSHSPPYTNGLVTFENYTAEQISQCGKAEKVVSLYPNFASKLTPSSCVAKPERHSQRPCCWPELPSPSCTQTWFLPHAPRSLTLQTVFTGTASWGGGGGGGGGDVLHSGTEMEHGVRCVGSVQTKMSGHDVFETFLGQGTGDAKGIEDEMLVIEKFSCVQEL